MDNMDKYLEIAKGLLAEYTPKLLLTLLTLWVGFRLIGWIKRLAERSMERSNVEKTLSNFVGNLINWGLKVLLFVSAASMVGIETTSFIAILGAAGLAIGLALQGALANLAGGVLLIIFRPYKVGDVISAQGATGGVKEIQIFTTILVNPDNETIIIPNGAMIGGNIKNISAEGSVRHNLAMGISYESNIQDARNALMACMEKHPLVLKDPAPSVIVGELADSSVNLVVRPWSTPENYWTVMADIMEQGKIALDENNITIPFPQLDLHLDKDVQLS